ncbi:MAG: membrane protein insertion efficiency factor YidD [Pseudomonadota bacterium]
MKINSRKTKPAARRETRAGTAVGLLCGLLAWWCFLCPAPARGQVSPAPPAAGLAAARGFLDLGQPDEAEFEIKRFLFFNDHGSQTGAALDLLAQVERRRTSGPGRRVQPSPGPVGALVRLYQDRLRTFRSPESECPSHPSCSAYTLQALEKHGTLMGVFMFVDRLWRETRTAGTPPFVYAGGRKLHFDPLELNDYWLGAAGKSGGTP